MAEELENEEVIEESIINDGDEITEEITPEEEEVEEYEPNYTYSVKGEDKEFDERVRGLITNKENEEYFRNLYTSSEGLPSIKENLERVSLERKDYEEGFNSLYSGYEKLRDYRDNGNLRELYSTLGITDEQAMKYAIDLAKEQQLPEQERQQIVQTRQDNKRIADLETRIKTFESSSQESERHAELQNLGAELAKPEYQAAVEVLAAQGLNPQELVISHGMLMTKKNNGVEPSIEEAVKSTMAQFNFVSNINQAPQNFEQKKVLRGTSGGGGSVVSKPIRSFDDLRALQKA